MISAALAAMAARRKREFEIATGVAQLILLVIFAVFFVPSVRQVILGLGMAVVCLVVFVVLAGIGIAVIRRANGSSRPLDSSSRSVSAAPEAAMKLTETTTDLIQQLRRIDWFQFEQVVALTYGKLGYKVTSRGGANPDGGIDVIVEMAGQKCAIQCKHWKTWNVGVKPVREFLGALTASGIQKGIFVILGGYTGQAKEFADANRIELVNETGLAKLLESVNARVDAEILEILSDKQKHCPKCGAEMKLRTGPMGQQFWGCSTFGTRGCRGRLPYESATHRCVT